MKKAFLFSTDGFFAIMLFSLVTVLIYLFYISFTSLQQQYIFADDLLTFLDRTKINELDVNKDDPLSSKYPGISTLIKDGIIKDTNIKIIEQIIIFKNNNNPNDDIYIETILNDLITEGIKGNYKFALDIGDLPTYGEQPTNIANLVARRRIAISQERA
ncbi:MAG: hypothetical protein AABX55_02145 [Nanoarchaeota archaeon]